MASSTSGDSDFFTPLGHTPTLQPPSPSTWLTRSYRSTAHLRRAQGAACGDVAGAAGLAADMHLVEVVPSDGGEESEAAIRYLDTVAGSHGAPARDVVERNDVGAALADTAASAGPARLCAWPPTAEAAKAPLGSTARSLLEHSNRPVVLVGPEAWGGSD